MQNLALNKQKIIPALIISCLGLVFYMPALANSQDLFSQPFLRQIQAINNPQGQHQVTIAIIDEGIDFTQTDLSNSDAGQGWNFLLNDNNLAPQGSHGTQVAGVILAASQNDSNIKLMNLIACNERQGCNLDAINRAIYYAADHGAQVINLSFTVTGKQGYRDEFSSAITYAYSRNLVIVAAAGNGDSKLRAINLDLHPISPVCNDGAQNMVLGVSATDGDGRPAPWSNFGSCVDVSAPGSDIYTTVSPFYNHGSAYGYKEGTSYAAPIAATLAAEIFSINNTLTARQVMDKIISHASPLQFAGYGSGLVNFSATLSTVGGLSQVSIIKPPLKQ